MKMPKHAAEVQQQPAALIVENHAAPTVPIEEGAAVKNLAAQEARAAAVAPVTATAIAVAHRPQLSWGATGSPPIGAIDP